MMRRAQAILLIMLGSYPPLHLYAHNQGELSLSDLTIPLAISLIVPAAIALSWYPVLKDWTRAALIAAWSGIAFWLTGYAANNIIFADTGYGVPEGTASLALFAVVYLAGRAMIASRAQIDRRLVSAMAASSGALILLSCMAILPTEAARLMRSIRPGSEPPIVLPRARAADAAVDAPDIIDIILDGYARDDILETRYGQSNREFLEELRRRGFHVLDRSTSNYSTTALSLASFLNMEYVTRPRGFIGDNMEPVTEMVQHNKAARYLRSRGYRFVNFQSGCSLTEGIDCDEYRGLAERQDHYAVRLIRFTPFSILVNTWFRGGISDPYEKHRRDITGALNGIAALDDGKQPLYVFAHIVCPHPPFVFRASGVPTVPDRPFDMWDADDFVSQGGSRSEYRQSYCEQVTHLNSLVLKALDKARGRLHRRAIIIIHSDHGPGLGLDFDDVRSSDLEERMSNLMAIRFPDGDYGSLYPTITGVNIYRAIFREYLGADLPLLPDRHFFASWRDPFRQTELTLDQIRAGGRPGM